MSDWSDWSAAYFSQMRASNRSPGTIRQHRHYLTFLRAEFHRPTHATNDRLVQLLDRPGWGPDAKKSARTVWRGFYKWAHGTGRMDEWVGEHLAPIRMPRRLPRPAPELIVRRAVKLTDRESLMCQLAAFCGLRAGEIAQVRPDRDLNGDLLRVHGKGSKERIVPVENEALLERLEKIRGWAFPSTDSNQHLTPGHVSKVMSRALPDGWTAHNLRHRYATVALDGSDDLLAVSELLGHASVATTQIYTKVSVAKLRRAARAASAA